MARNFMTAASSTAIPFFYDPVYYGYIPTNPPPDFSLPKPISDMTPQEKTQTKERFAKELRKALKEEEDNILKNFERPRDKFHRAMIIAEARGDEYLAEEIIRRDNADQVTSEHGRLPTRTKGSRAEEVLRLRKMLAVLFSLPSDIKQALLRGDLPALTAGPNAHLGHLVPRTPGRLEKLLYGSGKPWIYVLHLVNTRYDNPDFETMRRMLGYAKAYTDKVVPAPGGGRPVRIIKSQNYTATPGNLARVMRIDRAKLTATNRLFATALDAKALNEALQAGQTTVPCLYITSEGQLEGIKQACDIMEARMEDLKQNGWDPKSPRPLPSTIASCGWTSDAGNRRNEYYRHSSINGKIRIWDAISLAFRHDGLSWQCLFMPWHEDAVSMSEHIGHVLAGTYVVQGGMNGEAAGISVASKVSIASLQYKEQERKLLNTSHWVDNRDGTDTRNTHVQENTASLKRYFQAKKSIKDQSIAVEDARSKREAAEQELKEQETRELDALSHRNEVTAALLDDLSELDKKLQELRLIRETIYAVPGVQDLVQEENHTYWSQHSQVGYSQGITQTVARVFEKRPERFIPASSPPPLPSQSLQESLGGNDEASSAIPDSAVQDSAVQDPAVQDSAIPDSARDESFDELYDISQKKP